MTPLDLARLCQRAYTESTLTAKNVEVLVVEQDGALVISPRGTEKDHEDILTDLRFAPWYDGDIGWCHKGFLRAAQAIWPMLRDRIRDTSRPIWFTGHSLGGAITILCAAKTIKVLGVIPTGIVTFGAPRAGFNWIIPTLTPVTVLTCYRRGRDIVPTVPHAWWWRGPRHPVELTQIGVPAHLFKDHKIAGYIEDVMAGGGG